MDIERTVREAFLLPELAPDFEDAVMARLSAGAWRASHTSRRGPRRILLIGTLIAMGAAAAMLIAQHSGKSNAVVDTSAAPAAPLLQDAQSAAPVVAQPAPSVGATLAEARTSGVIPPATPGAAGVAPECDSGAAAVPAPQAYTVQVEPLQFESDDPVTQARLQEYYSALLDQMRKIPGLALVARQPEATAAKPADFRVSVGYTPNFSARPASDRPRSMTWLTVQKWNGTGFDPGSTTGIDASRLDTNRCWSEPGAPVICGPAIAAVADVTTLRLPRFPTAAQAACSRAAEERFAEQRRADPSIDMGMIRQGIDRLAVTTIPTSRYNIRQNQGKVLRPEMAGTLVTAFRESTDDSVRKEVLTLLAVKFAGDKAVRELLTEEAGRRPNELMGHVAQRGLTGDGLWRDYVIARVSDDRLSTQERLEAWYWMSDAMPVDQQVIGATMGQLLTTLQERDGLRVLAGLLAGTQKEAVDSGNGAFRLGQWAMRQIGTLNHPAMPELLLACFDSVPSSGTLSQLAEHRDDPRVAARLEAIAASGNDTLMRRIATRALQRPLESKPAAAGGN